MQHTSKKIIITGGPGFGKTTIINALETKGYAVLHEIAREIIIREINKGGKKTPWQDVKAFSKEVLDGRIEQYATAPEFCFLDRGIPDIIAFLNADNITVTEDYYNAETNCKYFKYVFITPPWQEIFQNDNERKEQFTLSVKIHNEIEQVYQKLGYKLIELPKLTVTERVRFIEDFLQENI